MSVASVTRHTEEVRRACAIVCSAPWRLAPILKIEADPRRGPEPYVLWPEQVALLRAAMMFPDLIILKARQLGVTWALALLTLWDCIAFPIGWDLVVSINEDEARDVNLGRVKTLYDSAPAWFHAAFPVAQNNATHFSIRHPEGGESGVLALPASTNAGRSRTFRRVIGDEQARWENSDERMASIRPAAADVGSVIRASTAKGYNGFHVGWLTSRDVETVPPGHADCVRMFIGALAHPGRDIEWVTRERKKLDAEQTGLGAQEYPLTPEEAFRASGACAFSVDRVIALRDARSADPIWRGRLSDSGHRTPSPACSVIPDAAGMWRVWRWPDPARPQRAYLVTADACGGTSAGDFAAAAVYDIESGEQVAALHARLEPAALAREMWRAGWIFRSPVQPALLAPEANNHGQAVVALLSDWEYPHLYTTERYDQIANRIQRTVGWTTTERTRALAIGSLKRALADGEPVIRDRATYDEMLTFIVTATGREEAEAGCHDDLVMTHAIAMAILMLSGRTALPDVPRSPEDRMAEVARRHFPSVDDLDREETRGEGEESAEMYGVSV